MIRPSVLGLALVLAAAAVRPASAASALDLIPEDAAMAAFVHNRAELVKKGDKLAAQAGIEFIGWDRPSFLFTVLLNYLNLGPGLDGEGPIAVFIPNFKKAGIKSLDYEALLNLVFVLPIKNVKELEGALGLKPDELKPGTVMRGGTRQVLRRGDTLYVCERAEVLKSLGDFKPLGTGLAARPRDLLSKADFAIHFDPRQTGEIFGNLLGDFERHFRGEGALDDTTGKLFLETAKTVHSIDITLRLEDGLHLGVSVSLDKPSPLLETLRAGPGASELTALPEGDAVGAYAAKGDGAKNSQLARVGLGALSREFAPRLGDAERKTLLDLFEKWYKHLKGSRAALYRIAPESQAKLGRMALVAIADTDDPDGLVNAWRQLADEIVPKVAGAAGGLAKIKFTIKRRAEEIGASNVDIVEIEFADLTVDDRTSARRTFGPDWNRIRLAMAEGHVVGLIGSDTSLLVKAIENLRAKNKGLAESPVVTGTNAGLSALRKLELHFSQVEIARALDAAPVAVKGFTSAALTVEADYVSFEFRVATPEAKPFLKGMGVGR